MALGTGVEVTVAVGEGVDVAVDVCIVAVATALGEAVFEIIPGSAATRDLLLQRPMATARLTSAKPRGRSFENTNRF